MIADVTGHVVAKALAERREETFASGIHHLTASGSTSWHGFASEIIAKAQKTSLASSLKVNRIIPLRTEEYPVQAIRPSNSRMSGESLQKRFGVTAPEWQHGINLCLGELT
jgi:dTDP-4-dehydrorhamnose reductase